MTRLHVVDARRVDDRSAAATGRRMM